MAITRRDLVWRLGIGAATAAAAPFSSVRVDGDTTASDRSSRPSRPIVLDTNGNAYGPSARAIEAVADTTMRSSRLSPATDRELLRDAIAFAHGIAREQIVLGAGAGEILAMAARAFATERANIVTALPTYHVLGRYAARQGATVTAVPLAPNWSHDVAAMLAKCDRATRLVYICNPNNPTGTLTRRDDIERFISRLPASAHVIVDEAYHHYVDTSSDYQSFIDRPIDDPRVIVMRSFSKVYGLGGLRVGYAVAAPETAAIIGAHGSDAGVDVIAARAAIAALEDREHVVRSRRLNADDRQEFLNQANARMLRCSDSQTNFVMLGTEHPVGNAVEQLRVAAIVDHFANYQVALPNPFAPLDQYVRVSLGTTAEMREFWRVWDMMGFRHM